MSGPVHIVSIITPKPGMIDDVIEKLVPYNEYIEAEQPDTLQYQLFRQMNDGVEVLVYIEVFKDMAALEAHRNTEMHKEVLKRASEDGLLAAVPDTKLLKAVGGFSLRS